MTTQQDTSAEAQIPTAAEIQDEVKSGKIPDYDPEETTTTGDDLDNDDEIKELTDEEYLQSVLERVDFNSEQMFNIGQLALGSYTLFVGNYLDHCKDEMAIVRETATSEGEKRFALVLQNMQVLIVSKKLALANEMMKNLAHTIIEPREKAMSMLDERAQKYWESANHICATFHRTLQVANAYMKDHLAEKGLEQVDQMWKQTDLLTRISKQP